MKNKDCTILLCSCDSYTDCWEPFFKLLMKYWPNCPYQIILNTESVEYQYEGLDIKCQQKFAEKDVPYGERMIAHIQEIKTPFTLVMMDDFFIRESVDEKKIQEVIKWLKEDDRAVVFSFQAIDDEMNAPSEKYFGYAKRPVFGEYKFNFQAAVWKTDYLLKSWKRHETPWEWETIANFRSFTDKYDFYCLIDDKNAPINYGFCNSGMGVFRGKWVEESVVELFRENDIQMDFSKRGFYQLSDKNVVRMKKNSIISNEFRAFKSSGLVSYGERVLWRIGRQIKKRLGQPVPKDWLVYMREQEKKHGTVYR